MAGLWYAGGDTWFVHGSAQNVLLQAVTLDLGAVPVGAFYDRDVQKTLALPADHEPLYLIPVGAPLVD